MSGPAAQEGTAAPVVPQAAVVVMGVSGSGKTTIGRRLADHLGTAFCDADDLHTPEALATMTTGTPLTDAERWPWLDRCHDTLVAWADAGTGGVLACSALSVAHRRRLAGELELTWVHLTAAEPVLRRRLVERQDGNVGPELLASQLATLEPPRGPRVVTVDVASSVVVVVSRVVDGLADVAD